MEQFVVSMRTYDAKLQQVPACSAQERIDLQQVLEGVFGAILQEVETVVARIDAAVEVDASAVAAVAEAEVIAEAGALAAANNGAAAEEDDNGAAAEEDGVAPAPWAGGSLGGW